MSKKLVTLDSMREYNQKEVTELKVEVAQVKEAAVQPDWNQNDAAAADYIKNRPFYTEIIGSGQIPIEITILDSGVDSEGGGFTAEYKGELTPESILTVELDGKIYENLEPIPNDFGGISVCWGNPYYIDQTLTDNGVPFILLGAIFESTESDADGYIECEIFSSNPDLSTFKILVSGDAIQIKKLDAKFLPDGLATEKYVDEKIGAIEISQSDWSQNDETAEDYIKNRPFYDYYEKETPIKLEEHRINTDEKKIYYAWSQGKKLYNSKDIITVSFHHPGDIGNQQEEIDVYIGEVSSNGIITWNRDISDFSFNEDWVTGPDENGNTTIDSYLYNISYSGFLTIHSGTYGSLSIQKYKSKTIPNRYLPDNLVTTDTNQTGLSGIKEFNNGLIFDPETGFKYVGNEFNWSDKYIKLFELYSLGNTAQEWATQSAKLEKGSLTIEKFENLSANTFKSYLTESGFTVKSSQGGESLVYIASYGKNGIWIKQSGYGSEIEGGEATLTFPLKSGTIATEEYVNEKINDILPQEPGWKIINYVLNHAFRTYNNVDFYHEGFADFIEYENIADPTKHKIVADIHITSEETISSPDDIGIKILTTTQIGNKWVSAALYVNNVFPEGFLDNTKYTNITVDKYQWITDITNDAVGRFNSNGSIGPVLYADRSNGFVPLVWGNGLELDTYNDGQPLIIGGKEIKVTYYDYHSVVNNKKS